MQGIGEILKTAREQQGISLDDVAEATKIRTKYLRALEEENFDTLPGDVYARGFATAYLKYLGIKDRPDVVEVMKPKVKEPEQPVQPEAKKVEEPRKIADTPKRKKSAEKFEETPLNKNAKLIVLLSVAAILALFLLQGVYSNQMANQEQGNQVQQQQQQEPEQNGAEQNDVPEEPVTPPEPEEPVYDGLEMQLEILDVNPNADDQCWMQITVDGKTTETTLSQGQIQDIKAAQDIKLNLGNAGVVKVILNGQDLGVLGNQGQVVKKTFRLEDYVTSTQ